MRKVKVAFSKLIDGELHLCEELFEDVEKGEEFIEKMISDEEEYFSIKLYETFRLLKRIEHIVGIPSFY